MHTLTVSVLNEQIKGLLETSFTQVLVEGELSRITHHNSGHIYFTLKDASSALSAVMFRGNASRLRFRLEEGMKVVVSGAITLYKPRGSYQINCFSIEPSGQGALSLAYEQLKAKLSAKGYFNQERKKPLPPFVKRVAFITSATGAALQDMLRVANSRYRLLSIDVYDVLVQGESAPSQISSAIRSVDERGYDTIVLARGGGSLEDLWAFNEEIVADAIFNAKTPIISAIGHEIDYLISDFVADTRAATPSAAMEILLPDTNELLMTLDNLSAQMSQLLSQKITTKTQQLQHLKNSFVQHSVEKKMQHKKEEILATKTAFTQAMEFRIKQLQHKHQQLHAQLPQAMENKLLSATNQLEGLKKMLESSNPKLKSKCGFAQISQNGKVIDLEELDKNDEFEVQTTSTVIQAKVLNKEEIV